MTLRGALQERVVDRVGRVHQSRGLIHSLSRSPEVGMEVGCLGDIEETLPSLKKFDGTLKTMQKNPNLMPLYILE